VPNLPEHYQADLPSPQAIPQLLEGWKNSDIDLKCFSNNHPQINHKADSKNISERLREKRSQ
jgi:hypothetical protein